MNMKKKDNQQGVCGNESGFERGLQVFSGAGLRLPPQKSLRNILNGCGEEMPMEKWCAGTTFGVRGTRDNMTFSDWEKESEEDNNASFRGI